MSVDALWHVLVDYESPRLPTAGERGWCSRTTNVFWKTCFNRSTTQPASEPPSIVFFLTGREKLSNKPLFFKRTSKGKTIHILVVQGTKVTKDILFYFNSISEPFSEKPKFCCCRKENPNNEKKTSNIEWLWCWCTKMPFFWKRSHKLFGCCKLRLW